MPAKNKTNNYQKTAVRVSNISIFGNALLTVFKLLAGIFAHSGAMLSDAVHSASDVLSSIIVIIGVKLASRESDKEHPYGHERIECVVAIVLSIILCITGLYIGHTAIEKITNIDVQMIRVPGVLALIAAIVSILSKEAMFRYTRFYAKRLNSNALMASAWHHRSDALSSIGALIGIFGARLGYVWLDPVTSLLICGFIVKAAYDIFADAIEKMVDRSCNEEIQEGIVVCASQVEGVIDTQKLQTRQFGNRVYVELEVLTDGNQTLNESNIITERVHNAIEEKYPEVKHIIVKAVPYLK